MTKLRSTIYFCFALILIFITSELSVAQQIQTIQISPSVSQSSLVSPVIPTQTDNLAQPSLLPTESIYKIKDMSQQPRQISAATSPQIKIAEQPSKFEQFISGKAPGEISTNINQFGYDLFSKPASIFEPSTQVPVGPGYVIGPGDEIIITVWGKIDGRWNVVVNRDGTISLPKIGVIGVTGLSFTELKTFLHQELSKYYTGFEMNVSMGALRSMRVYVVGNAQYPGAYTVSSLSTLVNALFQVGGPDKSGSMRTIQLKRNGQLIVSFDMYDFLLKGDKTKDLRLMPEDVIFIPPVGPLVGIAGNVKKPAIYELRGESRLLDVLSMTGGLTSTAFKGRIQVHRIEDHQFRTLFEGDLLDLEGNPAKNFPVTDGDLIKVFSIIETKSTMKLSGAVVNPGDYAITPGVTRLGNVISKAGGILYYASDQAELTRVTVTQDGPKTDLLNIDVSKAIAGDDEHDIPLEINDFVLVRTIPEWHLYETVSISGEVKYPGTYTIRKGDKLSSILERAGGYTDKAYLRGSFFTRESVRELQQQSLTAMVQRLEKELISESSVQVSTASSSEELESKKAVFEQKQQFISSLRQLKATGRLSIHLAHLRLLKNSKYDIDLEQGDSIYIPIKNSVVTVVGAVMSRGSFIYSDNLNYSDYVGMTGGYSKYADEDRVYVLKADGTARKLSNGFFEWNTSKARWEIEGFGEVIKAIEPGDTIVVPEELEHIAWMREIKDITQILYQIATTAGVLIVAF